jgi:hypothetical protein
MLECLGGCPAPLWDVARTKKSPTGASRILSGTWIYWIARD